jgi:hypothetical protein
MAKHQNLPFSETINVMLSNISQVITSGDNSSGQALYIERGREPRRKGSSQYLLQPRSRGSRSSRGSRGSRRSPYSRDANVDRDIVCSWCNKTDHRQRDCWTLQKQLDDGSAKRNQNGQAYITKTAPQTDQQAPQHQSMPPNTEPPRINYTGTLPHTSQPTYHDGSNTADSAHLFMAAKACYINNRPRDSLSWVLDTGATQHFTNDKTDLYGYKRFREPKQVFLGDDSFVYAEGQGTLRLQVGPYPLDLLV